VGHEDTVSQRNAQLKPYKTNMMMISSLFSNGICLEQMRRNTEVFEAEIDNETFTLGKPVNDDNSRIPMGEILLWGLKLIQAGQLRASNKTATICLVNLAVAFCHPTFNSSMITWNDTARWYGPRWEWVIYVNGHGTHVASTMLAALHNSDRESAGEAAHFQLHIIRALNRNSIGYESELKVTVDKCVDAGAQIINL
jgi:hypothetical protein